jgi:hypothetical protein
MISFTPIPFRGAGGPLAGQLQMAGSTSGRFVQCGVEVIRGHRQQFICTRIGHRPDQRIRGARRRRIEGKQGEHVGRTEPLPRAARVRAVAGQSGGDRTLPVRATVETDAMRLAAARRLAFAHRGQRRIDRGRRRHAFDVRRKAHRSGELALEQRRVGDPGQFAHALIPR